MNDKKEIENLNIFKSLKIVLDETRNKEDNQLF